MTTRTRGLLAIAASAVMGAGLLAADQNAGADQGGRQNTAAQQSPAGPGQEAGQNVDHEILQQLKQIAQDPTTAPDKLFLLNTAIDNQWEIQLSQQAQQKGQSEQVKQFAQQMVQDHQQMGQRLQQTAQQLNVQPPQGLPRMKQEELTILSSLSGKDFDQQYISTMNADHAKAVACFQSASALSQNPQVKQFATESLPKLREHRQMARQAAAAMGIMTHGDEAIPAGAHLHGAGSGDSQDAAPASRDGAGGTSNNRSSGTDSSGAGISRPSSGSDTSGPRTGTSGGAGAGGSGSGTGTSGTGTSGSGGAGSSGR